MKEYFIFSNFTPPICKGQTGQKLSVQVFVLLFFMVLSCGSAFAQSRITDKVKAEYVKLPNTSISSLLSATDEDEKTFYLYNESAGQFIGYGGYWDVQAVMSDKAVPFTIKAVDGKEDTYQLTSNRGGNLAFNNGNYSGIWDAPRFFVDMKEDYNGTTNTQLKMVSAKVGNVEGYTMTVVPSGCSKYDDKHDYTWMNGETYYLYPDASPENVVVPELLGWLNLAEINERFVWKILTLKQLKSLFENADASEADPAYATFYIKDADFGRKSNNIRYWVYGYADPYELFNNYEQNTTPAKIAESYKSSTNTYEKYWVTNGYMSEQGGKDDEKITSDKTTLEDGTTGEVGAYWHHYFGGYISCHMLGNNCQIRQTIHDLLGGWYEVMANGFTTTQGGGSAQLFALGSSADATTAPTVKSNKFTGNSNAAADKYQVFNGDWSKIKTNSQYQVADFDKIASMPETFVKASKEVNDGTHGKLVRVYVPDGGMLTIGARTYGLEAEDWSTVDKFQVRYLGEISQELLLDERTDHVDYLNDQYAKRVEGKKWTLYLHRDLNVGKWNSLVLPVSMTAAAVKATFGNDTKLSSLETGAVDKDKDPNTIYFTKVNLNNNDDIAIQEGKLYIINPTVKMPTHPKDETKTFKGTNYRVEMEDYYTVPGVEFNKNGITYKPELLTEKTIEGAKDDGGTITFTGLYYNSGTDAVMTGENYSINAKNGRWAYISKKEYPSKGFRGWLHLNKTSTTATAKPITFNINGVEEYEVGGSATDIEGLEIDKMVNAPQRVYNLNGQMMGTSIKNLSAGIYIVNGKKIVINKK